MGRPKYLRGEQSARERMIVAFWELLSQVSFEKMSVREVARLSRVNKNTFYYHFDNLDDLAQMAIDDILPKSLASTILEGGLVDDVMIGKLFDEKGSSVRISRLRILLSANAAALQPLLIDNIMGVWAAGLEGRGLKLTRMHLTLLSFAAGGLLSAVRTNDDLPLGETVATLSKSHVMQNLAAEIIGVGSKDASL